MALRAIVISDSLLPRGLRTLEIAVALPLCLAGIAIGCYFGATTASSGVAMAIFLACLIVPIVLSVGMIVGYRRTVRPRRFRRLEESLRLAPRALSADEACQRFAAHLAEVDVEFVSRNISPEKAEPFVSEFRRVEQAIGKELPRVWLMGSDLQWRRFSIFRRKSNNPGIDRVSAYTPSALQRRIAIESLLSIAALAIGVTCALVASHYGFVSASGSAMIYLLLVIWLVFRACASLWFRQHRDHRQLWFVGGDLPRLEHLDRSGAIDSSIPLEWTDLVCVATIRSVSNLSATDLGGIDWRIIDLKHSFVVTLPTIKGLPARWCDALCELLGPPSGRYSSASGHFARDVSE